MLILKKKEDPGLNLHLPAITGKGDNPNWEANIQLDIQWNWEPNTNSEECLYVTPSQNNARI